MLLAAHSQCPIRNPDRFADLRDIERLLWVFLHNAVEAAHYGRVLPQRRTILTTLGVRQEPDHCFDQRLLQSPSGFGIGNNFWSAFREQAGLRAASAALQ
jgi:hypothetical protein